MERTKDRYYSFRQIIPFINEIQREANAAQAIDAKLRTPYQSAVANLFERALPVPPAQEHHPAGAAAGARRRDRRRAPPRAPRSARPRWPTWPTSAPSRRSPARRPRPGPTPARRCAALAMGAVNPGLEPMARIAWAYSVQDAPAFNKAVKDLADRHLRRLARRPDPRRPRDHLQPGPALLRGHGHLRPGAARGLRLLGSGSRRSCGRPPSACSAPAPSCRPPGSSRASSCRGGPPVTNLYSSAVFVGWGAVLLGHRPRAHVPQRLRHRGGRGLRLRLAARGPPPLRRRRHHGDDAGGARLQLLAGHPRHHHHHRLQRHVPGRRPSPSPGRCASTSPRG